MNMGVLIRFGLPVLVAIMVWRVTSLLAGNMSAAFSMSGFVLVFGFACAIRMSLMRRRPLQIETLLQYTQPFVACVIVSIIVRMTHL